MAQEGRHDDCPLTDTGHCADHGAERERNMTTRSVGLWGLGIIIALLFSILNVGIPIYSKLSEISTGMGAMAEKVSSLDARVNRMADRLNDHMFEGDKK